MAWRFAGSPTFRSPPSMKAMMEGVVRLPSAFVMTTGSLPSMTETQLFVVPKSIPMILLIALSNSRCLIQMISLPNGKERAVCEDALFN